MIFLILYFTLVSRKSDGALRVLGGRDALKDEFPFVVRLEGIAVKTNHGKRYKEYKLMCTGAAVTPTWILSAGHCADTFVINLNTYLPYTFNQTVVARYNSHLPEHEGNTSLVLEAFINPGYDLMRKIALRYDIVLLRCQEIKVSRFGKVSAVEYTSLVGHEVVTYGFGLMNTTHNAHILQVMKGILVKCSRIPHMPITTLCMVPPCQVEAMTCSGDSGGPVMHSSGIVGVISMSAGGCRPYISGTSLDVISMISPVLDWISNTVAN